jgi:antitoxin (DNA-binding transcriptional repressor) of toxin-antitoxin stability system
MAGRPLKSYGDYLNAARVTIENSLSDVEIAGLVGEFGYPTAKLNDGKALLDAAAQKVNDQQAATGAKMSATQAFKDADKSARDAYQALAKVLRAIYQGNPAALTERGLTGPMPKSVGDFILAANILFVNSIKNPTELADYGYTVAKLTAEQAKIQALEDAEDAQEQAKGAAQQATQDQETAVLALRLWLSQYIKIARVALRHKKQLLEKLGIPARTTPRKKKVTPAATPPDSPAQPQ